MGTSQSLYKSLLPLSYFSTCLGLPNFKKNKSVLTYKLQLLLSVVLIIENILGYILGFFSRLHKSEFQERSVIRRIIFESYSIGNCISSVAALTIISTRMRKFLPLILEKLSYIDNSILDIHRKRSIYLKLKTCVCVTIFFTVVIFVYFRIYDSMFWVTSFTPSEVMPLFSMLTPDFACVQFITLILLIRQRFKFVVEVLEGLCVGKRLFLCEINTLISAELYRTHIRKLRFWYNDLFEMSQVIMNCYGFYVLAELCVTTEKIIFSMFYIIRVINTISSGNSPILWSNFAELILLFSVYLLKIAGISYACHVTSSEAKNVLSMVHKLMLKTNSQQVLVELQMFRDQIRVQEVIFKPYGILTLNLHLFHSILATSVTYLVIIFQF
ncbi:hypothetical protein L9F63_006910, partial [Diploptera punctata]